MTSREHNNKLKCVQQIFFLPNKLNLFSYFLATFSLPKIFSTFLAMKISSFSIFVCAAVVLVIVGVAYGDDDYTSEYCSSYMCSKYSSELKTYLENGCEESFLSLLPETTESTDSSTISLSNGISTEYASLLIITSFIATFVYGYWKGVKDNGHEYIVN